MLEGAPEAFGVLLTWENIGLILIGSSVGAIAAVLPGISPVTVMALVLVIVAGMEKYNAFTLLVTIMAASGFAGSMTSILLNVPGDGINAATTLDGFPMARKGLAGVAIGASATASALGALVGLGVLISTLPFQRSLVLAIGPAEIFALAIMGIALVGAVSGRSALKGIISGLIGMTLGFVGVNLIVGGDRFTFGMLELFEGIPLAASLIGLFAIPELVALLRSNETVSRGGYAVAGGVLLGVKEALIRPWLIIRSGLLGSFVGMVPGVGGSVAGWLAYFLAQKTSKQPEEFGHGSVEGVIAPEASIDAKEGGSLIPVLILGLPGSLSAAMLVAAFQFHGILPGATLFRDESTLIWVMIFGMVAANVLTSVWGLAFANTMVRITLLPIVVIAPVILAIGFSGAFAEGKGLFGVAVALLAGLAGMVLERFGYPRPPLLIGLILLPLAEQNFHQALQISRGELTFLTRPITVTVLALVVLGLAAPFIISQLRRRRGGVVVKTAAAVASEDDAGESSPPRPQHELALLTGVLALVAGFGVSAVDFAPKAQLFPAMVLVPLAGLTLIRMGAIVRQPSWRSTPASQPPTERSYRYVLGWLVALPVLFWLIGVKISVVAYILAFELAFDGSRPTPWRIVGALVSAALVFALLHFVFEGFLGVTFPPGLIGDS